MIEQSKGLLMGYYGIDADTAFAVLRRWSSWNNTKLRDVSERLVAAASHPGPHRSAHAALQEAIETFNQHRADHVPTEGNHHRRSFALS